MRKSTLIVLILLLLACGGMLFLADAYLEPIKDDLQLGQRLTRQFGDRGDVAPDTAVKALRLKAEPGLEGVGLRIELTPAPAVLSRPGGLRSLVRTVAAEAGESYASSGPGGIRWLRVRVVLGGESRDVLLHRGLDGQVGEPEPALPVSWPPVPPPAK